MDCSHVHFLLPQYVDVIIWPCAVVFLPYVQNCSNFRDLHCESLCSEPSVQPQHRKNGILCRKRRASYEWTGRHCTSSTTHLPAATRQSLGTEHLWTARPQSDLRTTRAVSLQPNAASVCYWYTIHCYTTVVFSYLTFRRRNFLLNFSTPVFKMWIIQEPKKVALW